MKFVSKKTELRLIKEPSSRSIDNERNVVVFPGKRAEFVKHAYYTDDPSMIRWLINHQLYGRAFVSAAEEIEINKYRDVPVEIKQESPNMELALGAKVSKPEEIRTNSQQNILVSESLADAIAQIVKLEVGKAVAEIKAPPQKEKLVRVVRCSICGKEFPNGFAVAQHRKSEHAPPVSPPATPPTE